MVDNMTDLSNFLLQKKVVYFDFDGVIKDSIDVKSKAFYDLFSPFGIELAEKVTKHHESNCGIARNQKLPIYLDWANQDTSIKNVNRYASLFGQLVKQAVIDSPWVPGVIDYLRINQARQIFILVSATPQLEILEIVEELKIKSFFWRAFGSPNEKHSIIVDTLNILTMPKHSAVMIGDSEADLDSALIAGIDFILRRTHHNTSINHRNVISSFSSLELDCT